LKWQEDAVPVDGAGNREPVGNPNGHGISLPPAQRGRGKRTIDGGGDALCAGEIDRRFRNREIKFRAAEYRSATCRGTDRACPGRLDDRRQAEQDATRSKSLNESAARQIRNRQVM